MLRILLSIGPTETAHFAIWHDMAGDAPPLTDPTNGLTFPDLNSKTPSELFQTSLVMPEPTVFLKRKFPAVSIIRPTQTKGAAKGALKGLTDDGLFIGQPKEFFDVLGKLAKERRRGPTLVLQVSSTRGARFLKHAQERGRSGRGS